MQTRQFCDIGSVLRDFKPDPTVSPLTPLPCSRLSKTGQDASTASERDIRAHRRLPCPVCARHAVRTALLARRRLRLTPEVNSGCAPAVGRAPDVARGPRALKNGLPTALPPSLLASGIIFPFTPSCRTGEAGRQKQGGAGGIISPACLFCLSCLARGSAPRALAVPFHFLFYSRGRSFGAAGRMLPLRAMVTTSQGMLRPQAATAFWTASSMPPQQGTSMRTTVMLRTEF